MRLDWIKCVNNNWCKLNTVNLDHEHFDKLEGVYIIWHGGNPSRYVRVGQGAIKERLACHRQDLAIQAYSKFDLFVTWASVSEQNRDGVEAYLFQTCDPLVGDRCPDCYPIEVNLPE